MYRNWRVGTGTGYGHLRGVQVVDHRGLVVAVAIGDVPELDPAATALMLAAAPVLLANESKNLTALENLLAYLRKHEHELPPLSTSSLEVQISATRAAIALATQVQS